MSRSLRLQILEAARALIEDEQHWCRGVLAQDEWGNSVVPTNVRADRRCGLGALIAAAYQFTGDYDQAMALGTSVVRRSCARIVGVNDAKGHAAMLALFDEAIEAAR